MVPDFKISLKSIVSFCMVIIFLTFQTALTEKKEPKSDSKSAEDLCILCLPIKLHYLFIFNSFHFYSNVEY